MISQKFIWYRDVDRELGGEGVGGGGWNFVCVCSGALKNRRGQGEGVKSGYWTKGLIEGLNVRGGGVHLSVVG